MKINRKFSHAFRRYITDCIEFGLDREQRKKVIARDYKYGYAAGDWENISGFLDYMRVKRGRRLRNIGRAAEANRYYKQHGQEHPFLSPHTLDSNLSELLTSH